MDTVTGAQFAIGDLALEIEPMQSAGGGHPGGAGEAWNVRAELERFADNIAILVGALQKYRWASSCWPAHRRRAGVSHTVHRILASIADEDRRFEQTKHPPADPRTGEERWSVDAANRVVGQKVDTPVTVTEKVEAVHDLASDEQVAARVATDLLHRPDVAFKAMSTPPPSRWSTAPWSSTPRRPLGTIANRPPRLCASWSAACSSSIWSAPAPQFTAQAERIMPHLDGHRFTDDERQVIGDRLRRVRDLDVLQPPSPRRRCHQRRRHPHQPPARHGYLLAPRRPSAPTIRGGKPHLAPSRTRQPSDPGLNTPRISHRSTETLRRARKGTILGSEHAGQEFALEDHLN